MSTSQNTYLSLSTDESTSGSFGGTSYSALSLTGNVRTSNQDSFGLAFVEDGHLIAAVADGMGGHAGGDLASSSAISIFFENMIVERGEDLRKHINLLISQVANRLSEIETTSPQYSGMGTTLSVVVVEGSKLTTAHIGDSRIYRIRNGKLTQLTSDHSWVQQQVEAGLLTAEQAANNPRRNLLVRTLSAGRSDDPDIETHDLESGDRILICSDGVHGVMSDEVIKESISSDSLSDCLDQLMVVVSKKGSPDNATAILISIDAV
jgi:protein phosphatase